MKTPSIFFDSTWGGGNMAWRGKVEKLLGHKLRPKQDEVFHFLLDKHSVFAVLPTSYGKSILFGGFGTAYQEMHPEEKALTLVISPLNALMYDQVESWKTKGIKAIALRPIKQMKKETIEEVKLGEYPLMFASPEIIQQQGWWKILKTIRKDIKLLAFDEGHLISRWGQKFRPDYLRSLDLRGILCKSTVLVVTATATSKMISHIATGLGLRNMKTVALPADRPEIFLKVVSAGPEFEESFSWYTDLLLQEKENTPKAIIFSRTTEKVIDIYFWLNQVLREAAIKDGAYDDPNSRLLEMFHGHTDTESQERIVANFRQPNSNLRCVVATIAFGLGVDIPNVKYVLHWGAPEDAMAYWQQVGRASRNGDPGVAICYMYPWGKNKLKNDSSIIELVESRKDTSICLRKKVLSYMALSGEVPVSLPASKCCYNCQQRLAIISTKRSE